MTLEHVTNGNDYGRSNYLCQDGIDISIFYQHFQQNIVEKKIGEKTVALLRKETAIYAFAATCPHSGARLCEGWLDMQGRVVCPLHKYRFDPANGGKRSWDAPEQVGFIFPAERGGFVVGLQSGLFHFDERSGTFDLLVKVEQDKPDNRLNDGVVDATGVTADHPVDETGRNSVKPSTAPTVPSPAGSSPTAPTCARASPASGGSWAGRSTCWRRSGSSVPCRTPSAASRASPERPRMVA